MLNCVSRKCVSKQRTTIQVRSVRIQKSKTPHIVTSKNIPKSTNVIENVIKIKNSFEYVIEKYDLGNIIMHYISFVPRPKITINKEFMKKLKNTPEDDELTKDIKEKLYNYFKKYYPDKFIPFTSHLIPGTFVRCVTQLKLVSMAIGFNFADEPELLAFAMFYIVSYIALLLFVNCDEMIAYSKYKALKL